VRTRGIWAAGGREARATNCGDAAQPPNRITAARMFSLPGALRASLLTRFLLLGASYGIEPSAAFAASDMTRQ